MCHASVPTSGEIFQRVALFRRDRQTSSDAIYSARAFPQIDTRWIRLPRGTFPVIAVLLADVLFYRFQHRRGRFSILFFFFLETSNSHGEPSFRNCKSLHLRKANEQRHSLDTFASIYAFEIKFCYTAS